MKRLGHLKAIIVAIVLVCMFTSLSYAVYVAGRTLVTRGALRSQEVLKVWNIRSDAALTTSYVDTNYIDVGGFTQLAVFFQVTKGSLTSFEYRVWWSIDGKYWYREGVESVSATVITDTVAYYTLDLTGVSVLRYYKIFPVYAPWMKLDVKGTGTVTNSSLKVWVSGVSE